MRYRRPRALGIAAIALAGIASAVVYPDLPARLATNWGLDGGVNGTMTRPLGAFFLPTLAAGVYLFMLVSPRFDPRKRNIEAFRGIYEWFAAGMMWFLGYVHALVLLWNLGVRPPIGAALAPAIGAVLYGAGLLVERAEPNWIAGIRTPWTLDDDVVWERTNRRAALALKFAGIAALGGLLVPDAAIAFVVVPALLAVAYITVYSYVVYRRRGTT